LHQTDVQLREIQNHCTKPTYNCAAGQNLFTTKGGF
jgi:hypothetical protein